MTKPHPRSNLQQLVSLRRICGPPVDPEHLGGSPQNHGVSNRICGGKQQELLCRPG
ncbi:MAG: hypothetical protein WB765_20240 [Acidimicrobiales bacterium]